LTCRQPQLYKNRPSGSFHHFRLVPGWLAWIQHVSWFKYSNEILIVNQWEGLEIPQDPMGVSPFKDGDAVIDYYGYDKVCEEIFQGTRQNLFDGTFWMHFKKRLRLHSDFFFHHNNSLTLDLLKYLNALVFNVDVEVRLRCRTGHKRQK
jgi:hypothetical protein